MTPEADGDMTPIDTTKTHNESRGGGRGNKAAIVKKMNNEKESRKRSRQDEKDIFLKE